MNRSSEEREGGRGTIEDQMLVVSATAEERCGQQFCFTFAVRLLLGGISVSVTIELFDRFTTECEWLVVFIREVLISTVSHRELQRWFLEIVVVVVEISRRIEVDVRV
ncbi:hypothetical protein WR25_19564 [Diploscapter pachys]|uniref:Uncharacterized protein n=1 Tax=Diploscapter pachys TaxID=2018661 RepID=A0A2A2JE80_9BILA|nr:hypothetical protein WR25_19564 [Diploscapter pachys]